MTHLTETIAKNKWALIDEAINIFLGYLFLGQLVTLIFFIAFGRLPLPNLLLKSFDLIFYKDNLTLDADGLSLDLWGRIILDKPVIQMGNNGDIVAQADLFAIKINPLKWATLSYGIEDIHLKNGALFCPQAFSLTGNSEPIASRWDVEIQKSDLLWQVNQFKGNFFNLRVRAEGNMDLEGFNKHIKITKVSSSGENFFTWLPRFLKWKPYFEGAEEPVIVGYFKSTENHPALIDVEFRANQINAPYDLWIGSQRARINLNIDNENKISGNIYWDVKKAKRGQDERWGYSYINIQIQPHLETGNPRIGFITGSAEDIYYSGLQLDYIKLLANFFREEDGRIYSFASKGDEIIESWIRIDTRNGSGRIKGSAYFNPESFYNLPYLKDQILFWSVRFQGIPDWRFNGTIGKGRQLLEGDFSIQTGHLLAGTTELEDAQAELFLDRNHLVLKNSVLRHKEWSGSCYYEQTLKERDYRLLISGNIDIDALYYWMGAAWDDLTKMIDIKDVVPAGDFDIRGNWHDWVPSFIYGGLHFGSLGYRGLRVDTCDLKVYYQPLYLRIFDLKATSPQGHLTGDIRFVLKAGAQLPQSMYFDIDSQLDVKAGLQVVAPGLKSFLDAFEFTQSPRFQISGKVLSIFNQQPFLTGKDEIQIISSINQPFRLFEIPIDALSFQVSMHDYKIDVDSIDGKILDGQLKGNLSIWKENEAPFASFSLDFNHASINRLILGVPYVKNAVLDSLKKVENREMRLITYDSGGQGRFMGNFNCQIEGHGNLIDLNQLYCKGIFKVENGQYKVQGLDISDFSTRYELKDGLAKFDDIVFLGPSAKISGHGTFNIDRLYYNFSMRLDPLGGDELPTIAHAFFFLRMAENIEVNIQGSLNDLDKQK